MKKLSKKQMRIEAAKDVLKQLRRRKVRMQVKYGDVYCQLKRSVCELNKSGIYGKISDNDSAQDYIDVLQDGCKVCAMGSLLISHIRLHNKVTVGELDHYIGGYTIIKHLSGYFTDSQLRLIEEAFESHSSDTKVERFGIQYKDPVVRLRAIMQNLIDNEGTFEP